MGTSGVQAEEWLQDLRGVLTASEEEWQARLGELVARYPEDRDVRSMKRFLEDHLANARSSHVRRMSQMTEHLGRRLALKGRESASPAALVREIVHMQEEIDRLSEDLRIAKDTLALMIGEGKAARFENYVVSIGKPGLSLRVLFPEKVPSKFKSLQPDRKALLQYYKSTGEIPDGVEYNKTKTPVSIKPA